MGVHLEQALQRLLPVCAFFFTKRLQQFQPRNLVFQKNLADYYYVELQKVEEALKMYLNILAVRPKDIETLLIVGNSYTGLKKFDDARLFFNRILALDPTNENVRRNLAALKQLKRNTRTLAPAEQLYEGTRPLMQSGKYDAATQALEKLLASHPEFALAHADLGVLYYKAGNPNKALIHYQKAVELDPQNVTFLKNLAAFYYLGLGQLEQALQIYLKVLEAEPEDTETLTYLGTICELLQKADDAKFFYTRALEIKPDNDTARQHLTALNQTGQIRSVQASAEQMYEDIRPLMDDGDHEKVIKALEGLTIQSAIGPITMRACDHQASTPAFWGQIAKVPGYPFPVMKDIVMTPSKELTPTYREIKAARQAAGAK